VTAILYLTAISEYDQMLYEDENTNRMMEALSLFEEICANRYFIKTDIILFLNKTDLFTSKIQKVPLTVCFGDQAKGITKEEECKEFIKNRFIDKNKYDKRTIYTHYTCATDTQSAKAVFNAVMSSILKRHLHDLGLGDG
jgi:guanine nucleotide-binding protein subunit alpha